MDSKECTKILKTKTRSLGAFPHNLLQKTTFSKRILAIFLWPAWLPDWRRQKVAFYRL